MIQPLKLAKLKEEKPIIKKPNGPHKKRQQLKAPKSPKPKKPKKGLYVPNNKNSPSIPRAKPTKRTTKIIINKINTNISYIPILVFSCIKTP